MTDRTTLAARILCAIVNTGGGKAEKVAAAFEYADLLLFYEGRTNPLQSQPVDKRARKRETRKVETE